MERPGITCIFPLMGIEEVKIFNISRLIDPCFGSIIERQVNKGIVSLVSDNNPIISVQHNTRIASKRCSRDRGSLLIQGINNRFSVDEYSSSLCNEKNLNIQSTISRSKVKFKTTSLIRLTQKQRHKSGCNFSWRHRHPKLFTGFIYVNVWY